MDYEIGTVYKTPRVANYYIAVDSNKFVTFKKRALVEFRPGHVAYEICREMPVEKLCKKWGISLSQLDEVSKKYFRPITKGRIPFRSTRKSASRKQKDDDYYVLRRARATMTRSGRAREIT
jgi:hypothetical protein